MMRFGIGAACSGSLQGDGLFAGNLGIRQIGALNSTKDRLERQQKAANEVSYWEEKKAALKEKECDNAEEIKKKLDAFHDYTSQIEAVKKAYNFEQMSHVMDEAMERAEKIAEAAEETKPKTEEERKEEAKEEAIEEMTGEDVGDGILEEMMEEVEQLPEEMKEALEQAEQAPEEMAEALEQAEQMPEEMTEEMAEALKAEDRFSDPIEAVGKEGVNYEAWAAEWLEKKYAPIDIRV